MREVSALVTLDLPRANTKHTVEDLIHLSRDLCSGYSVMKLLFCALLALMLAAFTHGQACQPALEGLPQRGALSLTNLKILVNPGLI